MGQHKFSLESCMRPDFIPKRNLIENNEIPHPFTHIRAPTEKKSSSTPLIKEELPPLPAQKPSPSPKRSFWKHQAASKSVKNHQEAKILSVQFFSFPPLPPTCPLEVLTTEPGVWRTPEESDMLKTR